MCLSAFLNGQYRGGGGGRGKVMAVKRCKTVSNAGIGWGNPLPGFFYALISVYCKDTVSWYGRLAFLPKDAHIYKYEVRNTSRRDIRITTTYYICLNRELSTFSKRTKINKKKNVRWRMYGKRQRNIIENVNVSNSFRYLGNVMHILIPPSPHTGPSYTQFPFFRCPSDPTLLHASIRLSHMCTVKGLKRHPV